VIIAIVDDGLQTDHPDWAGTASPSRVHRRFLVEFVLLDL
jgi:hypothetical protein